MGLRLFQGEDYVVCFVCWLIRDLLEGGKPARAAAAAAVESEALENAEKPKKSIPAGKDLKTFAFVSSPEFNFR
jgi:hypothetical protein